LGVIKIKRKTAEKAGPAGKKRKVDREETAIDIKLFVEIAEGMERSNLC
jgi:hypothetical protein